MSLTGRFSAVFLAALGLALVVFSAALYVSARIYLDRRVRERLDSALAILAAAAEIHPNGVEWEPRERALSLGEESGADRLRWLVLDERGRLVDRSVNLADTGLVAEGSARPGEMGRPRRLWDRQGKPWRVSRHVLRPDVLPAAGTRGARQRPRPGAGRRFPGLRDSLELIAFAPLGPTEATLATLAGLEAALSAGIWLAAAGLCRGLSRRALCPWRGWSSRRGGSTPPTPAGRWPRPGPETSSMTWAARSTTSWAGCMSPTSGRGGSAGMPPTSCGPR